VQYIRTLDFKTHFKLDVFLGIRTGPAQHIPFLTRISAISLLGSSTRDGEPWGSRRNFAVDFSNMKIDICQVYAIHIVTYVKFMPILYLSYTRHIFGICQEYVIHMSN
jgi:hypothetical protein